MTMWSRTRSRSMSITRSGGCSCGCSCHGCTLFTLAFLSLAIQRIGSKNLICALNASIQLFWVGPSVSMPIADLPYALTYVGFNAIRMSRMSVGVFASTPFAGRLAGGCRAGCGCGRRCSARRGCTLFTLAFLSLAKQRIGSKSLICALNACIHLFWVGPGVSMPIADLTYALTYVGFIAI